MTAELPTHAELQEQIMAIAMKELHLTEALPAGDLAENLDSVQRLTLVVAIEDAFEICFEPEDEQGVTTLDEVVGLVRAKLLAGDPPQ